MGERQGKRKFPEFDLSFDKRLMYLVILIVLVFSWGASNGINPFESISFSGNKGHVNFSVGAPIPPTQSQVELYSGQLDMNVHHRDALDPNSMKTEGKDVITTFYKEVGDGRYVVITQGDNERITVNSFEKLYFTLESNSTDLYISPSNTADWNLNPRILDFDFIDVDKDGVKEWFFEMDVTGIGNVPNKAVPQIPVFTMSYEKGEMFLNSPSDIEVYHENSITNIKWELEIPDGKAVAVNKVDIIFETVNSELISEYSSWVSIPYIDNLEFTELEKTVSSSETIYSFDLGGNSLAHGNYISTDENADPLHDMTVRVQTHLEENEKLPVRIEVQAIKPDYTTYKVIDRVNLIGSTEVIPTNEQILYELSDYSWNTLELKPSLKCKDDSCGMKYNYIISMNTTTNFNGN